MEFISVSDGPSNGNVRVRELASLHRLFDVVVRCRRCWWEHFTEIQALDIGKATNHMIMMTPGWKLHDKISGIPAYQIVLHFTSNEFFQFNEVTWHFTRWQIFEERGGRRKPHILQRGAQRPRTAQPLSKKNEWIEKAPPTPFDLQSDGSGHKYIQQFGVREFRGSAMSGSVLGAQISVSP